MQRSLRSYTRLLFVASCYKSVTAEAESKCNVTVSGGDASVGIDILTDVNCVNGGTGCIDQICRFCKVTDTPQSKHLEPCYNYKQVVPSDPGICEAIVSLDDFNVGVRIVSDESCLEGGLGCFGSVCRYCKATSTPLSEHFGNCSDYGSKFTAFPTVALPEPVFPSGDGTCTAMVSRDDHNVGVQIITDTTCVNGGLGCFSSVCRYCRYKDTPLSHHLEECTEFGANYTSQPLEIPAANPTNVSVGKCDAVVSPDDHNAGIDLATDPTCLSGGLGCFTDICRYCKVKSTPLSKHLDDCSLFQTFNATVVPIPSGSLGDDNLKCQATISSGDFDVGIQIVSDLTCKQGGLGCFSTVCRYCKYKETSLSGHLENCNGVGGKYTSRASDSVVKDTGKQGSKDVETPIEIPKPTPAPSGSNGKDDGTVGSKGTSPETPAAGGSGHEAPDATEPASCTTSVSTDDYNAGIQIVTDASCANGGLGCFIGSCRFCQYKTTPLSAHLARCSEFGGQYTSDAGDAGHAGSQAPPDDIAPAPSKPDAQGQSSQGGSTPSQTPSPVVPTESPTDSHPSADQDTFPNADTGNSHTGTQASSDGAAPAPKCTSTVSQGDFDVGIQIITDVTCGVGGLGCLNEICRYCKYKNTDHSRHLVKCSDFGGQYTDEPVSPPSKDDTKGGSEHGGPDLKDEGSKSAPPAVVPDVTAGPEAPSEQCADEESLALYARHGIEVVEDKNCEAGGLGCVSIRCRMCRYLDTDFSSYLIKCAKLEEVRDTGSASANGESKAPLPTPSPKPADPASEDVDGSDRGVYDETPQEPPTNEGPKSSSAASDDISKVPTATEVPKEPASSQASDETPKTPMKETPPKIPTSSSAASDDIPKVPAVPEPPKQPSSSQASDETPKTEEPPSKAPTSSSDASDQVPKVPIAAEAPKEPASSQASEDTPKTNEPSEPASSKNADTTSESPAEPHVPTPTEPSASSGSSGSTDYADSDLIFRPAEIPEPEEPAFPTTCSKSVATGDSLVGINIITDAACADGGVGCLDNICRYCKEFDTVQSSHFVDCVSVSHDFGDDIHFTPIVGSNSGSNGKAFPVGSDAIKHCMDVLSYADRLAGISASNDTDCASGGSGCFTDSCRYCSSKPSDESAHLRPCADLGSSQIADPTPPTATPSSDAAPSPTSATNDVPAPVCGEQVSIGDVAVGIYAMNDTTCAEGGLGCFSDTCRYCKTSNTPQAQGFVECYRITSDGPTNSSDPTASPTIEKNDTAISLSNTTAADVIEKCEDFVSLGDMMVGVSALSDQSCVNGGLGCFSSSCRFCQVRLTNQSSYLLPCTNFNATDEAPTPSKDVTTVSTCGDLVPSGDLTHGIYAMNDTSCISGGLGCFAQTCRYCKQSETVQSSDFISCYTVSPYGVDQNNQELATVTGKSADTSASSMLTDCASIVSGGDKSVGVDAITDPTCSIGGLGCFTAQCRFCHTKITKQSAHLFPCDREQTIDATLSQNDASNVTNCGDLVSSGDLSIGVYAMNDSTCDQGGLGCFSDNCRFCRTSLLTPQSEPFVECYKVTMQGAVEESATAVSFIAKLRGTESARLSKSFMQYSMIGAAGAGIAVLIALFGIRTRSRRSGRNERMSSNAEVDHMEEAIDEDNDVENAENGVEPRADTSTAAEDGENLAMEETV